MSATHANREKPILLTITRLGRDHASQLARAPDLFDERPDLRAAREYLADPRNLFLLASDGPTPIGFLRGTSLRQIKTRRAQMFLYEIGVDRRYRRRGVGAALVQWLLDYCRKNDYDEIFVLTSPANRAAVRLYRSTGAATETKGDRMFVYRLTPKQHGTP